MASKVFQLISKEADMQRYGLEMIPSENYTSSGVMKAMGSILTNKYSEGFPGARYYGGNEIIDEIERYACSLANKLFGTEHAIVQPHSGSPANLASSITLPCASCNISLIIILVRPSSTVTFNGMSKIKSNVCIWLRSDAAFLSGAAWG